MVSQGSPTAEVTHVAYGYQIYLIDSHDNVKRIHVLNFSFLTTSTPFEQGAWCAALQDAHQTDGHGVP
jgi:hypothetical protein